MTQSDQTPKPEETDRGARRKSQPAFGTLVPSFGSDVFVPPQQKEQASEPLSSRDTTPSRRPAFGTQMAPPPAEIDRNAVTGTRQLPSFSALRNVTQTHRAEGSQLSVLAEIVRDRNLSSPAKPQAPAAPAAPARPSADVPTNVYQRTMASVPDLKGKKSPGRSTWNLKIHRRDVAGHISGIINEIPTNAEQAFGLQSALVADDSVPEYEVLKELGAGNMGIVYRARQTSLNRELAIKTLKPDSNHAEHDQAMFVSEAVVTANLVHPNIVPIHDLGRTADGKLFYSMKQVSGTGWNDLIRQRSLEDNLDIFMKLCDAVAYAHSKGVINRDLKPENVIVGNYGEVVVLDWGLAITTERFEKRNSVVVEFRGSAGTPVYMPPELADEDVSVVGPHSDIYLLGAILFEVLEGFPPHLLRKYWDLEDPNECLYRIVCAVHDNEIEEDVVNKGELMNIARKAMSTEPHQRHSSVEELQDAIREYRITGRAEELMRSVNPAKAQDYAEYQSAVALYSEALRKWPRNQRAIAGDRNARLEYARLAHKKGDIDLGLQVVADHAGEEFAVLQARLKKTRLIRTIIRGTWGFMSVAVCGLLIASTLFWYQADEALGNLERQNGTINALVEKEADLNKGLIRAQEDLERAVAETNKAIADAAQAEKEANQKVADANAEVVLAMSQAEEVRIKAAMNVEEANQQATQVKQMADAAVAVAKMQEEEARGNLKLAEKDIIVAQNEKYAAELDGFRIKIDAYKELGDYTKLIQVADAALKRAGTNPLIDEEAVKTFQKLLRDAERLSGNAEIPLDQKPDSSAVSADGSTIAVLSRGTRPGLAVIRRTPDEINSQSRVKLELESVSSAGRYVAVSPDGRSVSLVGKNSRQLWSFNGERYVETPLQPSSAVTPGAADLNFMKCQFSTDGRHLYLFGSDMSATVEVYEMGETRASFLTSQKLAGESRDNYSIIDADVMPDESALLVVTGLKGTLAYPLEWTNGTVQFPRTGIATPELTDVQDDRFGKSQFSARQIRISPDGQLLALVSGPAILILPKSDTANPNTFPYVHPKTIRELDLFECSFPVRNIAFSRDGSRIATGHEKRYIQIWEREAGRFRPSRAAGLYLHPGATGSSLRGHSRAIDCVEFVGDSNDHLISVSADNTARVWNIPMYSDYVAEFEKLAAIMNAPEARAAAESQTQLTPRWQPFMRQARQFSATPRVSQPAQLRDVRLPSAAVACARRLRLGEPILTSIHSVDAEPEAEASSGQIGTADPDSKTVIALPRQGRDVFSALFSNDGARVLVGTDDLAAHVFDTSSGQRTLQYSMAGRKELFFEPFRNNFLEGHISEIAAVRFLPPRGELLLTADYFGSISVWDATPDEDGVGYELSRLLSEYSFSEFAVSDDGRLVLAGGATTNQDVGLKDADLNHVGLLWNTSEFMTSPTAVPFRRLEGQHAQFAITSVAISPSSEKVVTAGRRGRIVVWNVADGTVFADVQDAHGRDQVSGAFFESETQLITVGYDGHVIRWTIEPGVMTPTEVVRGANKTLPEFIVRLRPSPDRNRFATSDVALRRLPNGLTEGILSISIWSDGQVRPLLSKPVEIPEADKGKGFRHDISWSADGTELMFVLDGEISVYETAGYNIVRRFRQNQNDARAIRGAVAPSADGKADRAATFDGRVTHLWDLQTGNHLAEFRSHAKYNVAASFSADQRFVATGSETLRIFVADEASPEHGRTLYRLPIGEANRSPVAAVAFAPVVNDDRLATVNFQGLLELWHWKPEEAMMLVPEFQHAGEATVQPEWAEDTRAGNAVAWSPDGKRLASLQTGMLNVWDAAGDQLKPLSLQLPEGLDCRFNQIDFSSRDNALAAGGVAYSTEDNESRSFGAVWQFRDDGATSGYRLVATMSEGHSADAFAQKRKQRGITAIAFDDTHEEILTGGADGTLIRWQAGSFSMDQPRSLNRINQKLLPDRTPAHRIAITALDVSATGRAVSADEQGNVFLWPSEEADLLR